MLKQIDWRVQIGLSQRTEHCFIFQKFCFSLRASCKELIWCINYPNDHTHSFRKCWSFIWASLFPVSIKPIPDALFDVSLISASWNLENMERKVTIYKIFPRRKYQLFRWNKKAFLIIVYGLLIGEKKEIIANKSLKSHILFFSFVLTG